MATGAPLSLKIDHACDGRRVFEDAITALKELVEELKAEEDLWMHKEMGKTLERLMNLGSKTRMCIFFLSNPITCSLQPSEPPCAWVRFAVAASKLDHLPTADKIQSCFYRPNATSKARKARALAAQARFTALMQQALDCHSLFLQKRNSVI